jgi:hypothetical protein
MARSPQVRTLDRSRNRLIAILALLALLIAQSAAGLHALKHLGPRGDSTGLPGPHTKLCLECVSFAPLAAAHGAPIAAFVVVPAIVESFVGVLDDVLANRQHYSPYRSRAPPR